MRVFLRLFAKDVRLLFRTPQLAVSTFGFSFLVVVISSFAFRRVGYGQAQLLDVTPGILWIAFLFSGTIGLNQSFVAEKEDGAFQGLLLSGADPLMIYFSKAITNCLFLFVGQLFVIVAHGMLFGAEILPYAPWLALLAGLGAIGFAALGTLLAAISAATKSREVVLPLLLFPLSIPLLGALVVLNQQVFTYGSFSIADFWGVVLCSFDLIAVTVSSVLFEFVVKE